MHQNVLSVEQKSFMKVDAISAKTVDGPSVNNNTKLM
jgi:hypothetical protein